MQTPKLTIKTKQSALIKKVKLHCNIFLSIYSKASKMENVIGFIYTKHFTVAFLPPGGDKHSRAAMPHFLT